MSEELREDRPAPPFRTLLLGGAAIFVLLALLVLAFLWMRPRPDNSSSNPADLPPDPRLAYSGPFENVHPRVGFVGDAKCAECHYEIALSFAQHPMGRSAVPIRELAAQQSYTREHNLPFDRHGVRLWIERNGDRVWHNYSRIDDGQPLYEVRREVHYAIGSGTRGYSYLSAIDGFLYQSPISWFSQKKIWDLSPAFHNIPVPGRFILTDCLQCHVNRLKLLPDQPNRFAPGIFEGLSIGCERCHGPGEKHVARHERGENVAGDFDSSIVNPTRLPWDLRENVCEQCHITGEARELRRGRDWFDYRPGMPLESFFTVFVRNAAAPGENVAVGQVEQMRRSTCFQKSADSNKLGCVSCHDPHVQVTGDDVVPHYRQRCLTCHQQHGCALSSEVRRAKQPDDSCIACHMPRAETANVAHTSLTDHSIPRKPGQSRPAPVVPGGLPIVPFNHERIDSNTPDRKRDLGIALVRLAERKRLPFYSLAGRLLEESLPDAPTDPAGWWALGIVKMEAQDHPAALSLLERAHAQAPRDDRILSLLAYLEQDRDRPDQAIAYYRQAVALNPHVSHYHAGLVDLLDRRHEWPAAADAARSWIKLDPGNAEAHYHLLRALVEQGQRDEAERVFAFLRRLNPPRLHEMDAWYRRRR